MLRDTESQNGLHVRLDGPQGSNIVWSLADSTEPEGWSSAQIETISSLLPHIRQFVRMRQALADAAALGTSLADLLDNTRLGVIHSGPGADGSWRRTTARAASCNKATGWRIGQVISELARLPRTSGYSDCWRGRCRHPVPRLRPAR